MKALIHSATTSTLEKRIDAESVYARLAAWVKALCAQEWDGELLHDADLEGELDDHCAKYAVLDKEALRKSGYEILQAVAPKSEATYTKTSDVLITYVTEHQPDPIATDALRALIAVPNETTTEKFNALFTTIAEPLHSSRAVPRRPFPQVHSCCLGA